MNSSLSLLPVLDVRNSADSSVTLLTNFALPDCRPDQVGIATLLVEASKRETTEEVVTALRQLLTIVPGNEVAIAGLQWFMGIDKAATDLANFERLEQARLAEEAQFEEMLRCDEETRLAEALREAEEQARRDEEVRAAEELRRLEEERLAEEARQAEEARLAEERRLEEEARQAEEARLAEERRLEEARLAEQARLAEEARLVQARLAEEARLASEAKLAEQKRIASQPAATQVSVPSAPPSESASASNPQRKLKILAVDDSATIRKVVAMTLSMHGFEIISASDGIEALTMLSDCKPDIILSDIQMPRLDGYKLCKFVKKHPRTSQIPVILLSGKDGMFDKMRGKMSGCDGHIRKPFEASELLAQINQILGIRAT